jgi:hypothetical protein
MIDEHHHADDDEPASGTNAGPGQRDAEAAERDLARSSLK